MIPETPNFISERPKVGAGNAGWLAWLD